MALAATSGLAARTTRSGGILPPHRVPVDIALAEGRQAAAAPEEGAFWRWRRNLLVAHPDGPLARVLVATPYFSVMRESYRRSQEGRPMTGPEGRTVLDRIVKESGAAFPVTLVLVAAPNRRLPAPETVRLLDGSGRPVRLCRVGREDDFVLHLTYEFARVDPSGLTVRLAGYPAHVYRFDLRGMD